MRTLGQLFDVAMEYGTSALILLVLCVVCIPWYTL